MAMIREMMLAVCMATAMTMMAEERSDSLAETYSLDEIVITGTRTPKTLKDTPVQTRLITTSEINRADATNLQNLLQTELPGVEFSYAMNQQVNMNLGGFAGQSVLVLLDGERLAGETMDNVDFSRLPMSNVSRIEIIRGAASALYGSNAAGGIVNIITKEADRKWSASVSMRGGSHGEWRLGASAGCHVGRFSNLLDINFNRMDTYSVCLRQDDDCDFRKVYGFRSWNASDKFSWNPSDKLKVSAKLSYYYKEREYNPDMPDRYRAYSGGLRGVWFVRDNSNLEVGYTFDQYDKSDYNKSYNLDIRDYSNVQHCVRALYNHGLRENDVLTVGSDFMRDRLSTYQFEDGKVHSQYNADLFAQYDWNVLPSLELVGALRWDWYSEGSHHSVTPKVSLRYRVAGITFRGGYAGGFRAPTLKERYMKFDMSGIFDIHGNSALKDERSHNFNISAEYSWRNFYVTAGANYNLVRDKIATSGILYDEEGSPYIRYLNVKEMRVFGAEVTGRMSLNCGLSANLSYVFTHEESVGASVTQYCPARPHSVTCRLNWTHCWKKGMDFDVSISGRFLSKISYESMYMYEPFETKCITNPSYMLWKLQMSQRLWKGVRILVTIDNLLNYRPRVYSYNAPVTAGTSFLAGLDLEIDKLIK